MVYWSGVDTISYWIIIITNLWRVVSIISYNQTYPTTIDYNHIGNDITIITNNILQSSTNINGLAFTGNLKRKHHRKMSSNVGALSSMLFPEKKTIHWYSTAMKCVYGSKSSDSWISRHVFWVLKPLHFGVEFMVLWNRVWNWSLDFNWRGNPDRPQMKVFRPENHDRPPCSSTALGLVNTWGLLPSFGLSTSFLTLPHTNCRSQQGSSRVHLSETAGTSALMEKPMGTWLCQQGGGIRHGTLKGPLLADDLCHD